MGMRMSWFFYAESFTELTYLQTPYGLIITVVVYGFLNLSNAHMIGVLGASDEPVTKKD